MSSKNNVILSALEQNDREQFITDNQRAFKFGATEEFGMRDDPHKYKEEDDVESKDKKKDDEDSDEMFRFQKIIKK